MSHDTEEEITIVPQLTYDVLQTRHRERITEYSRVNGVDALALLGLYWHMASKPGGWRFSADRLAGELGVGRKRVLSLLTHLRALGYYSVTEYQDAGKWRKTCTFDAGSSWPTTDSERPTTPTEVPLRNVGARNVGRGDVSISTDLPSTDKSQNQATRDVTSPRDSKPPTPASDEQTTFLDELARLTDCAYTRHSYALTQAQTAIELGHDAASAVDELRSRGHNLRRVGPGFILKQLPTLTYKPAPSTAAGHALVASVLGDAFAMA